MGRTKKVDDALFDPSSISDGVGEMLMASGNADVLNAPVPKKRGRKPCDPNAPKPAHKHRAVADPQVQVVRDALKDRIAMLKTQIRVAQSALKQFKA